MKSRPNLLVVGARGYVGGALYANANREGVVLGTSSSGGKGLMKLRLDAPSNFDYGKISRGDIVMLTAAISAPDICARDHDHAWAVNVTGTTEFISRAFERGARVIFFSSDAVYGEQKEAFDEAAPCRPAGEYAAMKHEVEQHFAGNSDFKTVRLSYIFSHEDKFSKYLSGCVKNNEKADLFHPFYRAIVHRDDVVAGVFAIANSWQEIPESIINFGGPQVLSRIEMAECLRKTYLKCLRYKVTEPGGDFFKNRPRVIAMTSPVLARILERTPHTLCEAAQLEMASNQNEERKL